ncbi:hypothetical protein [uncultured Deinococcus sp.]|uniref:hypothetical protein n=1 Tax=uncultured Deinococcus sp. TaxID=158789 RepID=UPI0025907D59|nr:hypothetical protein [uncultured Deinococcus sp.]
MDQDGRKAVALQQARINSDRSLTDVTTGQPLRTIGQGPGDPLGGLLTWVESLRLTGVPEPVNSTHTMSAIYTAAGQLNLHQPTVSAKLVAGPSNALDAAKEALTEAKAATDQATLASEIAQQALNQIGGSVSTQLNGVEVSASTAAPLGGTIITLTPAQASSVDATVRPADLGGVVINLGGPNG